MASRPTPIPLRNPADVHAYTSHTKLDPRTSPDALDSMLLPLVRHITRRMRSGGQLGRTLVLRLQFGDGAYRTASHTLTVPTAHVGPFLSTARPLLAKSMPEIELKGVSQLSITVGNLQADPGQLELSVAA